MHHTHGAFHSASLPRIYRRCRTRSPPDFHQSRRGQEMASLLLINHASRRRTKGERSSLICDGLDKSKSPFTHHLQGLSDVLVHWREGESGHVIFCGGTASTMSGNNLYNSAFCRNLFYRLFWKTKKICSCVLGPQINKSRPFACRGEAW
jgi:hypothetical protein